MSRARGADSNEDAMIPPFQELAWYGCIAVLESWARVLPESEYIRRVEQFSARMALVACRPSPPAVALGRGLAQTLYCRMHGVCVSDRLDRGSLERWMKFRSEAETAGRAVFVSAHLGPFQLQMDVLAGLPQKILFLFRSYRWKPLASRFEMFRLARKHFHYVDVRHVRQIAAALDEGMSPAFLADAPGRTRKAARRSSGTIRVFNRAELDDWPVRMAVRRRLPIFVGGIFNLPGVSRTSRSGFGFDYYRIDPSGLPEMSSGYARAMEQTILNNPSDWVRLGEN